LKSLAASFLHGILLAGVSPVVLYILNPDARLYAAPGGILRVCLAALGLYVILAAIGFLLTRDPYPSGLFANALSLGLLYIWPLALLLVVLFLAAAVLLRGLRRRFDFRLASRIANLLAILVAGYYCLAFAVFLAEQPWASYRSVVSGVVGPETLSPADETNPDIYYIILDGYARADVLSGIYGYDNSGFLDALRQRGFFVASEAQANYPRTVLSLASSLNMQYLDAMSAAMGDSALWWPVEDVIRHSQVRGLLEAAGYRTVSVSSGFDATDWRDGAAYLRAFPVMLNDYEEYFFRFTNLAALQSLAGRWASFSSVGTQRQLVLNGFAALSEAATLPGHKFVFAHILAPHPPFVFDAAGDLPEGGAGSSFLGDANEFRGEPAEYRDGYVSQLQFVNTRILAAIDGILAASSVPPVILLQADHGPGLYTDYDSAAATCLWERFSILSAYHLPGLTAGKVPDDISPVSSFRLVFDAYFGADLGIIPDRQYFSAAARFYRFEDVTARSELPCALPNP
jgi:hypothetical protein